MFSKLIVRNAKRSMKDYLIYMITMGGVAALMFAFDSLLFSDMVQRMWETAMIMVAMISIVTVFIIVIIAWLIHYMVRFMLEKRSREFGTYLLMGMEKKQVSRLYAGENMLLGLVALGIGILAGQVLQQMVLMAFYGLFSKDYHIQISLSPWCILATTVCYTLCFLLALLRNGRTFQRMNISGFMAMENRSEATETGKEKWKQLLFFVSIVYFVGFFYLMFQGNYQVPVVILGVVGFIVSIYCFYQGLAAFLVCYIQKGGRFVYTRDGLFLLRQLSSKMRTMRFTMGTLTLLFTGAILCGTGAMMFSSYQKEVIHQGISFDVMLYSDTPEETFAAEQALIDENVEVAEKLCYMVYRNANSHDMNDYLYTHVANVKGLFTHKDGSINREKIADSEYQPYYAYDTYLALSDYNGLRRMLGLDTVSLGENQYLVHLKSRVLGDIGVESLEERTLNIGKASLSFAGAYTEAFSQNGMNGADYIFVVPDTVCDVLTPYYGMMVMDINGAVPVDLQDRLETLYYHSRGRLTEKETLLKVAGLEETGNNQEIAYVEALGAKFIPVQGSDEILTVGSYDVAVKENLSDMLITVISSITFPLAYIALIFVCVALTILAVQQLSDSNRYRYRYDVLRKMGVSGKELNRMIWKQLAMYYMIPILISVLLSGIVGIFAGYQFVFYTGADSNALSYYGISLVVFVGIYLIYFIATYVGFQRNVEKVFARME